MELPEVVVRRSARRKRTVTAFRDRDTIVVLLPELLSRDDEKRYVDDMVQRVLTRESRSAANGTDARLARRAHELVERHLAAERSTMRELRSVAWVTNQSQRWGSCTPDTGAVRLSHRLQATPSWVVDYVLLHELAHLAEPNHSARFWSLVDSYPGAERAKGFLLGFTTGLRQPGTDASTKKYDDPDQEGWTDDVD